MGTVVGNKDIARDSEVPKNQRSETTEFRETQLTSEQMREILFIR